MLTSPAGDAPVRFQQQSGGQVRLTAEGHDCRVRVTVPPGQPDPAVAQMSVEMRDAVVDCRGYRRGRRRRECRPRPARAGPARPAVPRRPVAGRGGHVGNRTAQQYLAGSRRFRGQPAAAAVRLVTDLTNHIASELNARAAFVVSCLLLVVVGSSLGMMFRSGNFLTAFAVSVVPAMLSTVLIVTGQHTAEATPDWVTAANNPLHLGLAIIWSGNVAIAIAAAVMVARLQRR